MQSSRSKPCRPGINPQLLTLTLKIIWICGLFYYSSDPIPCSMHLLMWPTLTTARHTAPSSSTTRFRVHATWTCLHTCVLKHWQQLLSNRFGLSCFFFFNVFIWWLKHIAYIKLSWRHGQTNWVCYIRGWSSNIPICADKLPLHIALFDELYAYRRGI